MVYENKIRKINKIVAVNGIKRKQFPIAHHGTSKTKIIKETDRMKLPENIAHDL
jgi:hypothetical protein